MKNLKYYITAILLLPLLSGCEKFLEHDHPLDVYDEIWWDTEANATNALNSVYVGIPDGLNGRKIMFLDALSDELVQRQSNYGNYESYVKGLQNSSWDVSLHIWQDNYKTIRRANRFLENVDKVYMSNETTKTRYKYEARALRAYYHMELLLLFGGVPIVTTSLDPTKAEVPRNTSQEVYDFILSELTDCAENLPEEYTNADMYRITSGACWALISRLALFYKKYDVARDAAKKIIDLDVYELYRTLNAKNSYRDLFLYTGELNKERIFFRKDGADAAWNAIAPASQGGKTILSPTAAIINMFETRQGKTIQELGADSMAVYQEDPNYHNNRDPRLTVAALLPGSKFMTSTLNPFDLSNSNKDKIGAGFSTATGYWVNKYLDPKDKDGTRSMDFMIIRYAEILLTYAESLIELGEWDNPDVVKYINEVRDRAGMPDVDVTVYNSEEKMRELVRRERTVELAFEGVRYYDIRRWGIFEEVMNGQVYGAYNPDTGKPAEVEIRSADADRDFYWPIPLEELLSNPAMEPNPNY